MNDKLRNKIEHLLDEPGEDPTAEAGPLRSRLAATFTEGLESAPADHGGLDPASVAAFLDGGLAGAERDEMIARVGRDASLRADVESRSELIQSAGQNPKAVPGHLLARAQAQFAPPAPAPAARPLRWAFSLATLFPRQRMAIAALAALVVVVAVPAGLIKRGSSGGDEPELTSVNEPATTRQSCPDNEDKKQARKGQTPAEKDSKKTGAAAKDPCAPSGGDATK